MPSPATITPERPDRWDWVRPRLEALIARRRPHRVLLLSRSGDALTLPEYEGLVLVRASMDPQAPTNDLRCRLEELPFSSRSFDLLIVVDLLQDETGPAFGELLRILDGGGRMVVLGHGQCCTRSRRAGAPAMRAGRLSRALQRQEFVIEQRAGHGIAGFDLDTGEGWRRPLLPFSDEIWLSARHHGHDPVVRPLRFARLRALGARPAVLDGLNLEAAA